MNEVAAIQFRADLNRELTFLHLPERCRRDPAPREQSCPPFRRKFLRRRASSPESRERPQVEKEQMLLIGPNETFGCAVLRIDKHDVLWIAAWRVDCEEDDRVF